MGEVRVGSNRLADEEMENTLDRVGGGAIQVHPGMRFSHVPYDLIEAQCMQSFAGGAEHVRV